MVGGLFMFVNSLIFVQAATLPFTFESAHSILHSDRSFLWVDISGSD